MGRTVNPLAYAFVGSNPTLPTFCFYSYRVVNRIPTLLSFIAIVTFGYKIQYDQIVALERYCLKLRE